MPNHIVNTLRFEDGKQAEYLKMLHELRVKGGVFGSIDFNKLIPMPKELDIECGSRGNDGLKLYCQMLAELAAPNANKKAIEAKYMPNDAKKELINLGKQYHENKEKHGFSNWYDFRVSQWGTKWESYEALELDQDKPDNVEFWTAWSPPTPIIEELSRRYPDVQITHCYADENIGYVVGKDVYLNGEIIDSLELEDGSKDAIEFACELWYEDAECYLEDLLQDDMAEKVPKSDTAR